MNVGSYVCLRLLETECGFPPLYDEALEAHFKELDDEYNFCRDKIEVYRFRMPKDFVELNKQYISLLQGIVSKRTTQGVDVTTAYTLFLITRYLVQYFKSHSKGDFAMSLCFWLRDFFIDCNIDWEQPRTTYFYKRRATILRWNNVVYTIFRWCRFSIFNKLFSLYYRLSPWT